MIPHGCAPLTLIDEALLQLYVGEVKLEKTDGNRLLSIAIQTHWQVGINDFYFDSCLLEIKDNPLKLNFISE